MDNKDLLTTTAKDDPSQPLGVLRREVDSLDDFEHLGHDSSPLKEGGLGDVTAALSPARDDVGGAAGAINTGVAKLTESAITDLNLGELSSFDPLQPSSLFDKTQNKMDSNLLQMGDHFPDRKEADAKLDKFLQEMSSFAPPPLKHEESPEIKDKDDFKAATQNFVDFERFPVEPEKPAGFDELERYSDSDKSDGEDAMEELRITKRLAGLRKKDETPEAFGSNDSFSATEAFRDVREFKLEVPQVEDELPQPEIVAPSAPPAKPEPPKERTPEPVKEQTPLPPPPAEPVMEVIPEKIPEKLPQPVKEVCRKPNAEETQTKKASVIDAEAIFCKMGLDAWFNPDRLNPRVESLIYWRDPKKSGPVFGGVLLILLALTYFSLISVVAYASLLILTGTVSFRIYKNIVQAVQKTGDGHPFKEFLEYDLSLSQEKVKEVSETAVVHINVGVSLLRRIFLVEDLIDSLKFGVLLWILTYLGAWFNGMTLIIIAWVALFTLPKVYEANKTQIDANLEIVRSKLAEITSKVKAAIPIGKKAEEKKEQ